MSTIYDIYSDDYVGKMLIERTIESYFDDELVSVRSYAFYNCSMLSYFDCPNVNSISAYAFKGCTSLNYVNIENVKTIAERAFMEVPLSGSLYLSKLTYIGDQAFESTNITYIEAPNFSASYGMSSVFRYCSMLTGVSFPSLMYIGGAMFAGCENLASCYLPNAKNHGYSPFLSINALSLISLPGLLTGYGQCLAMSCSNLESIYIPNCSIVGAIAIFCSKLKSVYAPIADIYNSTAAQTASSMLCGCSALEAVDFPSMTVLRNTALNECPNLKVVHLPRLSRIPWGNVFNGCFSLEALIIDKYESVCSLSGYYNPYSSYEASWIRYNSTSYSKMFVYVPASLVEAYRADIMWSHMSSKILGIEDLPSEYSSYLT